MSLPLYNNAPLLGALRNASRVVQSRRIAMRSQDRCANRKSARTCARTSLGSTLVAAQGSSGYGIRTAG